MGVYATDGQSIKTLNIDDVMGQGFESSIVNADGVSPSIYYDVVPFVRRAVNLRANAIAGVPVTLQRGTKDISQDKAFTALMADLKDLLWRTEYAMCLAPFGAYWRKQTNKYKLNPTPEWLLPRACWPYITADKGLTAIRYIRPFGVPGAGEVEYLNPETDTVRFWFPSLFRANWPGEPPGFTALASAGALANRDAFVADYFKRGAVKGVLLQVPQTTQATERDRLKTWWGQVVGGVKNAWKANVISADVKPIIIGEGLAETNSDSLTRQYREDTAAAFEIPVSKMLSNAANYATARQENITFYVECVFPELERILDAINTQWLQPAYDCELVAHPEQTEAMQDAQVQQAAAITELVGQPVLTVNEGRAWLGMEPMADDETPDTEAQDYATMEDEANADDRSEQDAERVPDAERVKDAERVPDAERFHDAERTPPPAKAYRHADGRYRTLPGSATRAAERAALLTAHATMRHDTRLRHQTERKIARQAAATERSQANDAGARLKLVQRHRAAMSILQQRHAAERAMLRSLHAAERARMKDRHAAARKAEGAE